MVKTHPVLRGLRAGLLALIAGALFLPVGESWAQQAPGADWWSAIDRDDASAVRGLLLRNVDPNAFGKQGNPALIQAIRDQSWAVFDALRVAPGVQIDEPNAHDETALMYLCILGQTDRASDLIAAGAHVNRLGWTPLHYAASKGRVETARMLIKRGAIVNAPGPDGTTPLMMAALSGSKPMVELLLAQKADPTMFNLAHETAADWARKRKNTDIAQRLDEAASRRGAERQLGVEGGSSAPAAVSRPSVPAATVTPSAPAAAPSSGAPQAGDQSSFSRYFDLGRFDQPAK
ncbi:MAG: ankyrin repeat domain-containing protein [Castellaniella sp.]|uniref:ankyrin repeat domain-containing protein n=1 Tax=Castellaniella sp. TaxID=1955812 RepID=UPI0012044C12|nr:ankyrin repeat domain-containing protein [Castellaniella sp.]TAN30646.1 MAG: ankyrin repeat domain-containing protein [Castellaniella sp.]